MTLILDDETDLAVRKHCMKALRDLGVRSLNEIEPHTMAWGDLQKASKRMMTASRDALDRITDKTSAEERRQVELACDGVMELFNAIEREYDVRTEEGSREPRAQAESAARLAKRPIPGAKEARTDDEPEGDICPALTPEQRFTDWAKARVPLESDYRGLSVGQYLRSMVLGGKTEVERRALSEGSDSAGGYTVPDVLSATLIDLARANSVVMQAGAQTVPLTSDTNNWAKLLSDPVPAWRAEAGNVAESDPTFGLMQMIPRSLAVQTKVSVELMEDSLNLATELPRVLAAAMAVELDRVALLGSGTAPEPRGIANTSGIGTVAQDAIIANYANLSKARTAILTANSGPVSAYIMHPRDEGSFTDLVDSDGQPLRMNPKLEAIPMLTTTSIPVDGGSGSDESTIIAGNFSRLLVGIRSDIRVEVLKTSAYASNLQYTLLAHMRVDVAVTHPGAFYTITGVGQAA
ncbi:phage major capsid protein [Marivita sp. S6314]|uniref:phage major capsid protein n=1 Tax=Marivita sp. S6314 TaxID=2926406 RepID=UPI001FF4D609|nr:phage major capsid protein [Marivita sp. S6314]MCK0151086.1 phage major capsid protein [Marivita sp. S6314]